MSEKEDAIVTVRESELEQISKVSSRLKRAGCEIASELDFLGQILIRCEREKMSSLEKIKGVLRVERSKGVQLPPPESDLQ